MISKLHPRLFPSFLHCKSLRFVPACFLHQLTFCIQNLIQVTDALKYFNFEEVVRCYSSHSDTGITSTQNIDRFRFQRSFNNNIIIANAQRGKFPLFSDGFCLWKTLTTLEIHCIRLSFLPRVDHTAYLKKKSI